MDTNLIYCGDCKEVLKKIPDESIDLIYLDPPFFSQQEYENFWIKGGEDAKTRLAFTDKDWHKIRHSIDPNILKEYENIEARWKGGHKKGIYVYIAYMRERLNQCERVLKKEGSIYLHCDWHASHYLKQMMDELFGYDNFRNEIIWRRTNAKGLAFRSFANNHDSIFIYSKSKKFSFNPQYLPHNEKYLADFYKYIEPKTGRKYTLADLTNPNKNRPNLTYEFLGFKRVWRWTKERMQEAYERGIVIQTKSDAVPRLKRYLDEQEGMPVDSIWSDIPPIQSQSSEGLGYPTQKPEALLHRIIDSSSNKDNIVLDPFCGCGTTLAVAKKLGRQYIGIDISRVACDVMKKRLGGGVKVIGGETPEELAKMEPHEFARLVIVEKMGGIISPRKSGDMGIDGWIDFKTVPVQVKRWEHSVGRPEIDKFITAIERDRKQKGIIVAREFSKDSYAEVARIEKENKIKIELKKVDEIFDF